MKLVREENWTESDAVMPCFFLVFLSFPSSFLHVEIECLWLASQIKPWSHARHEKTSCGKSNGNCRSSKGSGWKKRSRQGCIWMLDAIWCNFMFIASKLHQWRLMVSSLFLSAFLQPFLGHRFLDKGLIVVVAEREPAHEVRAKRGETGFMSQAAMERVSLGLSGCQAEASTKNCIELVWMLLPKGNNVCELHANFLVFQSQQMRAMVLPSHPPARSF